MQRKVMFADRIEAGRALADRLVALPVQRAVVIALPRGGVPVAAEIARRLGAPLDVALVRKLGAPGQPELAAGAVADGAKPEIVLNEKLMRSLELDAAYISAEASRQLAAIAHRRAEYRAIRPEVPVAARTAVVVDDGVATGMTMQAALRQMRRREPRRLIAAVPVASRAALALLQDEADEVVCLASPRRFRSVSAFYRAFDQVSDAEVIQLLAEAAARAPA